MKQALALKANNDNFLWADTVAKEVQHFRVAFKILTDGSKAPIDHQNMCDAIR